MARSRRKSREAALRALYMADIRDLWGKTEIFAHALNSDEVDEADFAYAEAICNGVFDNRDRIDREIATRLTGYTLDRVAAVDRNVLRIATYEVLFEADLAPAITINEAVEIAKKYSTAESGRFVNGVLGRLVRESDKANWSGTAGEPEEAPEPEAIEEVTVSADSEEAVDVLSHGWKIRTDFEAS